MEKLDMRTYTKAEFDEDLFEVANVWGERTLVDLAERSEELWKNEAAAKLVKKAADARRAYRTARLGMSQCTIEGADRQSLEYMERLQETLQEKCSSCTQAVYDLLVSEE